MHPAFQTKGDCNKMGVANGEHRRDSLDRSDQDESDDEEIDLTTNGCIDYSNNNNKH